MWTPRCAGLLWPGPQDGRQRCCQPLRAFFWLLTAHGTCMPIAQVRSHGGSFRIAAWLPVRWRCCNVLYITLRAVELASVGTDERVLCSGGDPVVEISNITLHIDISGVDLMQKLRKGAPVPAPAAALAPTVGASRRLLNATESNGAAPPHWLLHMDRSNAQGAH